MRCPFVLLVLSLFLPFWLTGCGGNGIDKTLLYEETQELLEELIDNLKREADNLPADEVIQKAAEFLRNSNIIKDVYYNDNGDDIDLYAKFRNGIHLVIPVVEAEELYDPLTGPDKKKGRSSLSSIKAKLGLVKGSAVFLDLAKGLPQVAQKYQNMAAAYGFDPENCTYGGPQDPFYGGVEFFRDLHDFSLIYISTHGQYLTQATTPVDTFVFQTNRVRNRAEDEMYWQDKDFENARIFLGLTLINS